MRFHLLAISCEPSQDDELVFPKSTVKVTSKRRPANQALGLDLTAQEANAMAKPRHLRSLGMVRGTLFACDARTTSMGTRTHTHTRTTAHRSSVSDDADSSMHFLAQVWRVLSCCVAPSNSIAAPCNQATGYLGHMENCTVMALASEHSPALLPMQFRHAAQANRRGALQQVPRSLQLRCCARCLMKQLHW